MTEKVDRIIIYQDRSVLYDEEDNSIEFTEGPQNKETVARYKKIWDELAAGWLDNLIAGSIKPDVTIENLSDEHMALLAQMVDSVTSEVGRALVGLTVMQLTIKSLDPEQSIRLHKGSKSAGFSWTDGIPMRVLDKNFITPALRHFDLLKLNADGFMMTRSLAENYPYSKLYKAAIRGAKNEWVQITDALEDGTLDANNGLKFFIAQLQNKTDEFNALSEECLALVEAYLGTEPSFDNVFGKISGFVDSSEYSARVFEVSIHSFYQVLEEYKKLPGFLKPLSQMRSANKKHGNIGDIEVTTTLDSMSFIEAWDAKYGKDYLRDELEELHDKLADHAEAEIVGFVTFGNPNLKDEVTNRRDELQEIHQITIRIDSFSDWVNWQIDRNEVNPNEFARDWLRAVAESLCQRRRKIAPIDEPTANWVKELIAALK